MASDISSNFQWIPRTLDEVGLEIDLPDRGVLAADAPELTPVEVMAGGVVHRPVVLLGPVLRHLRHPDEVGAPLLQLALGPKSRPPLEVREALGDLRCVD